jgi:hypothetical protein
VPSCERADLSVASSAMAMVPVMRACRDLGEKKAPSRWGRQLDYSECRCERGRAPALLKERRMRLPVPQCTPDACHGIRR